MAVEINNVAVIGAGDMGHGIAEVVLLAGIPVHLYDINDAAVDKGRQRIFDSLDKLASKDRAPADLVEAIKGKLLTPATDLAEAVRGADLVIEAVPEVLDLKKQVFADIEAAAPAHALFASNTSTMSITEIASATQRPDKMMGLHFFNPAVLMKLVEVVRADETSDETIAAGLALVERLGKVGVLVRKDTPGFIANRVNAAPSTLIGEIVERGEIEPEALDAFMRFIGAPMGPCELADYVGIDVAVNVAKYFARTLHPDYGPPAHLLKMAEAGDLGKKTGRGYFDWSSGRPEIDLSKATIKFNPMAPIFLQINEATKLVEDGVCSINDVDVALINSTGNPMGPMSVGRSISRWDLTDQLEQLAANYGKVIFGPTQKVREGGHKH